MPGGVHQSATDGRNEPAGEEWNTAGTTKKLSMILSSRDIPDAGSRRALPMGRSGREVKRTRHEI